MNSADFAAALGAKPAGSVLAVEPLQHDLTPAVNAVGNFDDLALSQARAQQHKPFKIDLELGEAVPDVLVDSEQSLANGEPIESMYFGLVLVVPSGFDPFPSAR